LLAGLRPQRPQLRPALSRLGLDRQEIPAESGEVPEVGLDGVEQFVEQCLESIVAVVRSEKIAERFEVGAKVLGVTDPSGHDLAFPHAFEAGTQGGTGERTACVEVRQPLFGLIQQSQMNVLSLEPVVMVEATAVDQRDVAFAVAGNDLLASASNLFRKLGEASADLVDRHEVV
jgi:hypothetical protein